MQFPSPHPFRKRVALVASLIHLIIELVVLGLIYWVVSLIPLPNPFGQIIRVIFVIIAVIIVLAFLLPLAGISAHL